MEKGRKRELLEAIQKAAGCEYMSDLHVRKATPSVREAVAAIAADEFSAAEWAQAAEYIAGEAALGVEAEQIKRALLEKLPYSE